MEEKEIKIQVPEGYEIDKENSTFECIKFKKKELSYNEILSIVYNKDKNNSNSEFRHSFECHTFNNNIRDKISSIYKLIIVAKYLNESWVPNFNNGRIKNYCFYIEDNEIFIQPHMTYSQGIVYFKSEELAQQAIEILGEETIKQALSTDY